VSEQLIIRLGSEAHQPIHWLIWSDSEKEIIGSGEVSNASALQELTEKAQTRHVICLVPDVDVTLKSVEIKGTFTRQMQQALPYMLEDDLACDVDRMHFSVFAKETDLIHVAICFKNKIEMWVDWLKEAEIVSLKFIPEALALPFPADDKWQALQLENHWIVREALNKAWSCDSEMLGAVMQLHLAENTDQVIESYTPIPENCVGKWVAVAPVLPMQLLAEGCVNNRFNLLTGDFKVKKENNLQLGKWKVPAITGVLLFSFMLGHLFLQEKQTEQQILLVEKQTESVYKKAFPKQSSLKYSRIKKKLKGLLSENTTTGGEKGLLVMLNDLTPVFKKVPSLQISTLKFNDKKHELNLSVSADSFQAFEKLGGAMPEQYLLEQGALNNSKNRVSGALTVRVK